MDSGDIGIIAGDRQGHAAILGGRAPASGGKAVVVYDRYGHATMLGVEEAAADGTGIIAYDRHGKPMVVALQPPARQYTCLSDGAWIEPSDLVICTDTDMASGWSWYPATFTKGTEWRGKGTDTERARGWHNTRNVAKQFSGTNGYTVQAQSVDDNGDNSSRHYELYTDVGHTNHIGSSSSFTAKCQTVTLSGVGGNGLSGSIKVCWYPAGPGSFGQLLFGNASSIWCGSGFDISAGGSGYTFDITADYMYAPDILMGALDPGDVDPTCWDNGYLNDSWLTFDVTLGVNMPVYVCYYPRPHATSPDTTVNHWNDGVKICSGTGSAPYSNEDNLNWDNGSYKMHTTAVDAGGSISLQGLAAYNNTASHRPRIWWALYFIYHGNPAPANWTDDFRFTIT